MNFIGKFLDKVSSFAQYILNSDDSKTTRYDQDALDINWDLEPEEVVLRPTAPIFSTIERTMETSIMKQSDILVAIDTSGSTNSYGILKREIEMLNPFNFSYIENNNNVTQLVSNFHAIQWSTSASIMYPNVHATPYYCGT